MVEGMKGIRGKEINTIQIVTRPLRSHLVEAVDWLVAAENRWRGEGSWW